MSVSWLPPNSLADVSVDKQVIQSLTRRRQLLPCTAEAGGQLFGEVIGHKWRVLEASGLRRGDVRSLFGFIPNRAAEQKEIDERYARGLHYLGDWHTHRERSPQPSPTDLESMKDMIADSETDLPCFLLVIVGLEKRYAQWHVSVHFAHKWRTLN